MNGCYVDFVRVVARVLFIQHWQAEESRAFRANPSRGMYGLRDNVRTRISTYQEPERMPALANSPQMIQMFCRNCD